MSVVGARRGSLIDIWQLATGKRQQKYVVSTSNRVVINFECGAPTKKKTRGAHTARRTCCTHLDARTAELQQAARQCSGGTLERPSQVVVDLRQTFHLFASASTCHRLLKVAPEGPFGEAFSRCGYDHLKIDCLKLLAVAVAAVDVVAAVAACNKRQSPAQSQTVRFIAMENC